MGVEKRGEGGVRVVGTGSVVVVESREGMGDGACGRG